MVIIPRLRANQSNQGKYGQLKEIRKWVGHVQRVYYLVWKLREREYTDLIIKDGDNEGYRVI